MLWDGGTQMGKADLCWPGEALVHQGKQLSLDTTGNSQTLEGLSRARSVLCKLGLCLL